MRITLENSGNNVRLAATAEEYDAIPSPASLVVGYRARNVHPDRLGLAAYLSFGHWVSGHVAFPEPISPALASAIEDDAAPVRVRPLLVEYAPRALPIGRRTACVLSDRSESSAGFLDIVVLAAHRFDGALLGPDGLDVASNALAFHDDHRWRCSRLRARLAVAVLAAEDLDVDVVVVAGTGLTERERHDLEALLASVRLGLEFAD